jgi:dephospho-CoA kinase
MRIVIITGGIGSGKSQIMEIIRQAYPQYGTISADAISKEITDGKKFKKFISSLDVENFKTELFTDKALKRKIERFVHWRVFLKMFYYLLKYWLTGTQLVAVEIPIWMELKMDWLTRGNNVLVVAKLQDRIDRLKIRHLTVDQITQRINVQLSDEEKLLRADFVIENFKGISELEEKVKEMIIYYKPSFINILFGYIIFFAILVFFLGFYLNRWW